MVELANLATSLEDKELTAIANEGYEAYQDDYDSCSEHRDKHSTYLELYHQTHKAANQPWSWSSDSSMPLITEAVNQFQSRGYKAFFPSRNFVQALPQETLSPQALQAAERVGKYLSYMLTVEDRGYRQDKNSMFQAAALHGCDFSKVFYNPLKGRVCVERVRACDLIVPYHAGPCRIDDLERKTQVIMMSLNKAARLVKNGFFSKMPDPYRDDGNDAEQKTLDEIQGIQSGNNYNKPLYCKILEQHTYIDIDGDGLAEPYILSIDATSKRLLRAVVRYEVDEQGNALEDKEPIEYFTKFGFLPNADGFLDNGIGHLLGGLNISINRMLRQIEDAGTLANVGNMSGFISENLGVKKDAVSLDLGNFKSLPKTVSNIRDSIYQFQFPGANPSLVKTFEYLVQAGQRAGSVTDAVTGDIEKVLQPLSIMTLLESSLQLPTSVMEQMAVSFEDELNKIYRLQRKYMRESRQFIDGSNESMVMPEDFAESLRIVPILDPKNITRQQKIAKAQELYNFTMANPMLAQDSGAVREATNRMLIALDTEEIDKMLPAPPEVQRIDSQDQENMYFMLPKEERPPFDVFEDQDHKTHIAQLDDAISALHIGLMPTKPAVDEKINQTTAQVVDGFTNEMTQEILIGLLEHRRKHMAYLYGQQTGSVNGQGPTNQMDANGNNPALLQGTGREVQSPGGTQVLPSGQSGTGARPTGGAGPAPIDDASGILGLAKLDIGEDR